MIPDSLAPGIVIRAPDKTSARESGDKARESIHIVNSGEVYSPYTQLVSRIRTQTQMLDNMHRGRNLPIISA